MNEKEAIAILKKYAPDQKTFQVIYQHGLAVQKVAVIIAQDIKRRRHKVDLQLVKMACLLHDMGHYWYPPRHPEVIRHGLKAAQILKLVSGEGAAASSFGFAKEQGFEQTTDVLSTDEETNEENEKDF